MIGGDESLFLSESFELKKIILLLNRQFQFANHSVWQLHSRQFVQDAAPTDKMRAFGARAGYNQKPPLGHPLPSPV